MFFGRRSTRKLHEIPVDDQANACTSMKTQWGDGLFIALRARHVNVVTATEAAMINKSDEAHHSLGNSE